MTDHFYLPPRKNVREAYVDLDSTLAYPTWEPGNTRSVVGAPIPENVAKLQDLVDAGWAINIHTARHWGDKEMIIAWLEEHNIPFDTVICGKPLGIYIDDKAINATAPSWLPNKGMAT